MNEQQVLQSVGRPGWQVVSRQQEMRTVTQRDENNQPVQAQQPTGNFVWIISDGQGNNDQVVVKPVVGGPNKGGTGYEIVKAPEKSPPPASKPAGGPLTDYIGIGADGQPVQPGGPAVKLYNPKTGSVIDLPNPPSGQTRPPAPTVDTSAQKIPVWNAQTGQWEWQDNPNYRPPAPPAAPARHVSVVGNDLVDTDSGKVVYQGAEGIKFQTAQDGTILAIDPSNPSNVQTIWSPPKVPAMVPGQNVNQPAFLFTDPSTGQLTTQPNPLPQQPTDTVSAGQSRILRKLPDGSYIAIPDPAYVSKQEQALQDLHAGIDQIQQQLASGQIDVATANKYKGLLQQNYEASLQGTTPYQQYQDQQTLRQQRAQMGQSLLNQRVQSGTGLAQNLLSSALGIVGNKNFMDPSALAGFAPFSNAAQYVTDLGGGSDVYNAAKSAVLGGLGPDPATALLSAALTPPSQPTPAQTTATAAVAPEATGAAGPAPYVYSPETAIQSQQRNMMNAANNGGDVRNALLISALSGRM